MPRGKKSDKKKRTYFGEAEEQAVIEYLTAASETEKNRIYNEKLKIPFEKMVSGIIRAYHYKFGSETFEETFDEAIADLMGKLCKYDINSSTRAYSYYGTVCRNHLKERFTTKVKKDENNPICPMGEDDFSNDIRYSDTFEKDTVADEIIKDLTMKIGKMLDRSEKYKLREKEIIVGKALVKLFENWDYILSTRCSEKLNKNAILLFLRDETGMSTKLIRDNMKKFGIEYASVKRKIVNS